MKNEDFFHREADKGEAFRLLSEFYHLPQESLFSTLKILEIQMGKACSRAFSYVSKMAEQVKNEENIEPLQVDFSKLFVGPFSMLAPPYGSVYMEDEKTIMGDSTLDAMSRYKEEGLDMAVNFHDAPDHIAAELEFLYFLIFKALEAARHSDMELSRRYLEKRKRFLMDHLGAWMWDFQQRVEEKAETSFYKNLAKATTTLIKKDLEELSDCAMALSRPDL